MRDALRSARCRIERTYRARSLRAKLVLILTGIGLVGSIALTLLLASVIVPSVDEIDAARTAMPRDVSLLRWRMLLLAVAGSTLLLIAILLTLRRTVATLVLEPLARIERHMQKVRAGTAGLLAEDDRKDEIGSLGASFNAMLRQLQTLRERVEVQSFALGKSESAVAVMHNVRNALNPVSTILSQRATQPPAVDRAVLDRAVAELARGDLPEARRLKLAAFLAAAFDAVERARDQRLEELQVGREAMSHVLEIIGAQQSAALERPALEACDVTDIVARNATIARYTGGVSIAFSFPGRPHRVMASRIILSQVIGNLFANAADAIAASGRGGGSIGVTIHEQGDVVRIAIRDDGEGFAMHDRATLFQRGFSTRKHRSGGLGLHWCANAVAAMGGALRLQSEGPGRGAVAVLTLAPVAAVRTDLAA